MTIDSLALELTSTTVTPTVTPTPVGMCGFTPQHTFPYCSFLYIHILAIKHSGIFAGPSSEPYLLFANRDSIRRSSLMASTTSEVIVNTSGSNITHVIVGIDFDIRSVKHCIWHTCMTT